MQKQRIESLIDKNAIVDKGDGVLEFKGGLVLSDESVQKNGTRYEINSMDIDNWDGTVFADHEYGVTSILGNAIGVAKKGKKLVAQGVKFAVEESALADFVYRMTRSGFVKAVSIGTLGRLDVLDDEEMQPGDAWGIYRNARLIEFSFVGIGNNDNAVINSTAKNVYEDAKAHGLDTRDLALFVSNSQAGESGEIQQPEPTISSNKKDDDMKFVTIKNGRDFAVEVSYKNAAGEDVKATIAPGMTLDVAEEQKNAVEKQLTDAKAPEAKKDEAPAAPSQNGFTKEDLEAAINAAVKPLADQVTDLDQQLFDRSAAEPEFKPLQKGEKVAKNEFEAMDWQQLTQNQIEAFWNMTRHSDQEAGKLLSQINSFNKEKLVEAGLAKNSLGASDFGNFVTNPELITEIQGYRSDYSELLGVFSYQETNSLELAWLLRNGDIDMTPVGLEPTDQNANANLKPISEYGADIKTKNLEELAAVTPVCNSATIFLAADLLGDVAQGYRHSYDRNLARGIVSALEKAAEDHAPTNSISYSGSDAAGKLENIRQAIFAISQGDGSLILNEASWGIIWSLLTQTGNGAAVVEIIQNGVSQKTIWGKRVAVVPNDLMPTLGNNDYKTFSYEGGTVTVNHALFYANPMNFRGRQNGGLRYDLSAEAAYEQSGVVKSAFQRNEIVLRGSMFRGTAILDGSRVGAVRAQTIIS